MLDRGEQARRLREIAAAAQKHGCFVAPVGSVYFLFRGVGHEQSKDIDAVVHDADLAPVELALLKEIASELGPAEVTHDQAVVKVKMDPAATLADVELIRGRPRAKGGYFPRASWRRPPSVRNAMATSCSIRSNSSSS